MNLIILLDDKEFNTFEKYKNSWFLINNSSLYKQAKEVGLNCVFFNVGALYSSTDKKILDDYALIIRDICKDNDSIKPILNFGYLRIQLPILMLYQQIKLLIQDKGISRIILFGGSEYTFLPSFGGEGEGKRRLYKASWFFNIFIYQLFFSEVEIEWRKKERKIKFFFLQKVRDSFYQIKAILFQIKTLSKGYYWASTTNEAIKYLFYSNLPVQQAHVKHIRDKILRSGTELFSLYCPKDTWWTYSKKCKYQNKKIISTYFEAMKLKIPNNKNGFLRYNSSAFLSLYRTYYLYYLYEYNNIKDILKNISRVNITVISDMTIGFDIFALNQVCCEQGYRHINYQYVSMPLLPLPVYEMADEYYLYSKDIFDLYKQKSNIFKRYIILKKEPNLPAKIKRITLFLQPDEYTQSYIDFLNELCELYKKRKADFIIYLKPHPRQDRMSEFNFFVEHNSFLEWVSKDLSADEAILSTDIVVSILSTTLYEAFTYGVIGVICNYKKMYTNIVTTEACCSEVNFIITSASELYDLIDEYEVTCNNYLHRYYKYSERIKEDG